MTISIQPSLPGPHLMQAYRHISAVQVHMWQCCSCSRIVCAMLQARLAAGAIR